MTTNPRFDISSSSPDSAAFGYSSSHRSHYANLDRASSFRENHEGSGRAVTPSGTGPSFSNMGSTVTHGELPPLSQVLSLELIPTGEQKYAKQIELRRATIAAIAMVGEAHGTLQRKPIEQQGIEELKRMKGSLLDNAARARERSHGLSEAIAKLDKYRISLQSRKRARTEPAHERPLTSVSGERPIPMPISAASTTATTINPSKASFCPSPSHASIAESSVSKLEDKNKGPAQNKRVRTSMLDVRLEGRASLPSFQRSSGLADREREPMKSGSSHGGFAEERDRLAAISGESWEKTKTKGRRSTTKPDCVLTTTASGVTEMDREHKWGTQHRSNTENRPRSTEGHSFRSGPVHGVVSIHKSAIRNEPDNTIPAGEKEGRLVFPEKERPTSALKNGVKRSHKEEGSLLSPTIVKAKAARAPRSGTGIPVNQASAHAPRPPSVDVWDRAAATAPASGRAQLPVAPSNRKRPAPTRSCSPPVAQWVGQRPQKMSRIARRMNIPPPVGPAGGVQDEAMPISEGNSVRDTSTIPTNIRSNPSMSPVGGLVKRVASTTVLSQIKSKSERVASPAGLSESDDSGAEFKSKDKWKKHAESEGRFAAVNQKMVPLFSTGKKSGVGPKEEGGDGVRRQGRSGRSLIAVRESSNVTHIDRGDPSGNAKQLRSARPGVEKLEKSVEVKPGRPPTKKGNLGDRKALSRQGRPAPSGGGEVSGESDDDWEELMAAVQAAVNASATACSSMFWKEMEPFFAYLTPGARDSLKIQVKARELEDEEVLPSLTSDTKTEKLGRVLQNTSVDSTADGKPSCLANGSMVVNGDMTSKRLGFKNDRGSNVREIESVFSGGWPIVKELPLSQRLLAALIIEGDIDVDSREDRQGYLGDGSSHDLSDSEQAGVEKDQDSESEVETRRGNNGKLNGWLKSSSYDVFYTSNGHRHWDSESELLNSPVKAEVRKEEEENSDINKINKWDGLYQSLTLDERIAMELQSIGLYPDQGELATKEHDQIAEELKKFQMDLKELVHVNKERLSSLELVVSNSRATEERERERLAMRKLLENAFSKRLGTRGGHLGVSGSKNAASKAGRAAAVTIVKRSLVRWKHFVATRESCCTEAGLREILFCISTKDGAVKPLTSNGEGRIGINAVGLMLTGSKELKLAASAGVRWVCRTLDTEKVDKDSCESDQFAVGTPSERPGDKDDLWCIRPKEREVLLEDVVGSGSVGSVLCGTKGKRSDRERDAGNIKGERKTKTKPRQKTVPLLKAVNGLLGKPSELREKQGSRINRETIAGGLGGVEGQAEGDGTLDLSHLQIPGMDDLVVNDLGGQGQDLGSWLDFDDPGLPDAGGDFMGLDVPMDDLADLAMMM